MVNRKRGLRRRSGWQVRWRLPGRYGLQVGIIGLCVVVGIWLLVTTMQVRSAALKSTDAVLVLGGSIRRELYVAGVVKQNPEIPVLISSGSKPPCIWLMFQRAEAPIDRVWLENCAQSTFGNFYFSIPILRKWNVHNVKLVTSPTHLPRAIWLAKILLGAHGIWVEPDIVSEQGVPGNRESWLKTSLDVSRSLLWAVVSQVYQPHCTQVEALSTVNLAEWQRRSFRCEHQSQLQPRCSNLPGVEMPH